MDERIDSGTVEPGTPRRARFDGARRLAVLVAGGALLAGAAGCGGSSSSPDVETQPSASVSPTTSAASLQDQYVEIIKQVGPSVVVVETDQGLGSGIVFDDTGDIVTNNHVVSGANQLKVISADGKQYAASLVGTFAPDDLAVVHIDAAGLSPAAFGDSSKLEVGDIVLAIGSPLGLQSSVTSGIVSALGRTVGEPNGATLPNTIQTSAPINPGNSGGALVDLAGNVIGIPTLAAGNPQSGGTAAGIGFAIPSNVVQDIAAQLIADGKVTRSHRAFLGVRLADSIAGPIIQQVDPGSPAEQGGLEPGEVITAIDGRPTPSASELASVLANLKPGQQVTVDVSRPNDGTASVTLTLGELPG